MDALFDIYQVTINPSTGITVKTKDTSAITVLTIPAAMIAANTAQALPSLLSVFSTAMLSGKSFTVDGGTLIFNSDGSLSGVGINVTGETWKVNSSGQLVLTGSSKGTSTSTIVSGNAAQGWTVNSTYTDGSTTAGTLTPVTTATTNVFTSEMLSSKSFTVTGGTLTFNADGSLSGVGINVVNETWKINSSGQLVIYGSSKGTSTSTLVSGNATQGWTANTTYTDGTTATMTLVPANTPPQTTGFTTAMLSGKSYTVTGGTLTFNTDGSLSGIGINVVNETWKINSSGQLVIYGSSKGTSTTTLVSGNATQGWTGNTTYTDGTTATMTLVPANTPPQTTGFTTAMLSGKSFTVTGGTLTFNTDGSLSGVGINVVNETWKINSSGQLVIYGSSKGTSTSTLVSGDATHGWTGNTTYTNGTTATMTLVPA